MTANSQSSATSMSRQVKNMHNSSKLVKEVCSGIENLRNYSKLAGERLLAASLYLMFERDIMCKGVVNRTWDLGGTDFRERKPREVVNDREKLVVQGLIEEVIA
ncbi:hypothetical protein ACFX2I_026223 [Malus domestica]